MEFFLEMLFTLLIALLLSFPLAKLVSVATAGNSGGCGNDSTSDQPQNLEIDVGDDYVTEKLRFGLNMDARVIQSERNFRVVDESVESVDRFRNDADRVYELLEAATGNVKILAKGEELVVITGVVESMTAISPENVIAEEIIVHGLDDRKDSVKEIYGEIEAERNELMVRNTEAESTASDLQEHVVAEESVSTERISACQESGDVLHGEQTEVRVEESVSVEESEIEIEGNSKEEKDELSIEEDDDWEGIERSELEKAFLTASNLREESVKEEEISDKAKMELYGLHKIATEGSCREAQPMAVMVSARAKWNAWKKLGNMSQEEAMEQYLSLISKEIPLFTNSDHTFQGKGESSV